MVERCCLNQCWWSERSMFCLIYGRMIFSSVLASGEKSAIGRYEAPIDESLLGLAIGIIFAVFHILGMSLEFRTIL